MSAETINRNAAEIEERVRQTARLMAEASAETPEVEALRIVAETMKVIIDYTELRAANIDRKVFNARMQELHERAGELEEQGMEGLRSRDDAIAELDRMQAGAMVWLAQHRLDTWEAAQKTMVELMTIKEEPDAGP